MRVPDLGALGFAAVKDFLLCWLELIHFDSYDSGGAGLCYGTRGVRDRVENGGELIVTDSAHLQLILAARVKL